MVAVRPDETRLLVLDPIALVASVLLGSKVLVWFVRIPQEPSLTLHIPALENWNVVLSRLERPVGVCCYLRHDRLHAILVVSYLHRVYAQLRSQEHTFLDDLAFDEKIHGIGTLEWFMIVAATKAMMTNNIAATQNMDYRTEIAFYLERASGDDPRRKWNCISAFETFSGTIHMYPGLRPDPIPDDAIHNSMYILLSMQSQWYRPLPEKPLRASGLQFVSKSLILDSANRAGYDVALLLQHWLQVVLNSDTITRLTDSATTSLYLYPRNVSYTFAPWQLLQRVKVYFNWTPNICIPLEAFVDTMATTMFVSDSPPLDYPLAAVTFDPLAAATFDPLAAVTFDPPLPLDARRSIVIQQLQNRFKFQAMNHSQQHEMYVVYNQGRVYGMCVAQMTTEKGMRTMWLSRVQFINEREPGAFEDDNFWNSFVWFWSARAHRVVLLDAPLDATVLPRHPAAYVQEGSAHWLTTSPIKFNAKRVEECSKEQHTKAQETRTRLGLSSPGAHPSSGYSGYVRNPYTSFNNLPKTIMTKPGFWNMMDGTGFNWDLPSWGRFLVSHSYHRGESDPLETLRTYLDHRNEQEVVSIAQELNGRSTCPVLVDLSVSTGRKIVLDGIYRLIAASLSNDYVTLVIV